jgi:hypothetical protein
MALNKQNPLMEKASPVLWVQDLKNGNVGGGFMTSEDTWYTRDLNWIGKNTIPGAGIKPNNTTLHTTKGFMAGDVGRTTPINSPASGNNFQLSKLVLPVGEYYIDMFQMGNTNQYYTQFYNVSDSVEEFQGTYRYPYYSPTREDFFLTVTGATKEYRIEVTHAGVRDMIDAMGYNSLGASQLIAHADIKIYKIG